MTLLASDVVTAGRGASAPSPAAAARARLLEGPVVTALGLALAGGMIATVFRLHIRGGQEAS